MTSVYKDVDALHGEPRIEGGNCVSLIKQFAPGLAGVPTTAWREGVRVVETRSLARGTAIATFEKGRYPRRDAGQGNHAAFFLAHAADGGIWVMDQMAYGRNDPIIAKRHIRPLGKKPDGTYINPSNNAEAFSAIER